MSGADFLDSNIFLYLYDSDSRKQQIAQGLVSRALEKGTACISFQVVQETLNVLTRKFVKAVPIEVAHVVLREVLLPLWRIQPNAELYRRALDLQARLGFSFYDCLIVSAALEAGCARLLTEDLQHGQRIDGLKIENPFRDSVSAA